MKINLLDPKSFSGGHPHGQYDWLRENEPVYFHDEPKGRGLIRKEFASISNRA